VQCGTFFIVGWTDGPRHEYDKKAGREAVPIRYVAEELDLVEVR
jgi:hypothetical protein